MKFIEIKPSIHLRKLVECFWRMEIECEDEPSHFLETVIPDGSTEMIFHLGENVSRFGTDDSLLREPTCLFIGQNTEPYRITARGAVKMFGIKFYPHASRHLIQESASQFNNKTADLSDLLGMSVDSLYQRIGDTDDPKAQSLAAEAFLDAHFQKPPLFVDYIYFAINRLIKDRGQSNLSEIVQSLGVTSRYLEKLFLEYVGISPKTFAQITQLQHSVRLLTSDPLLSLTDISYACGYYDQSHFIRAFKRFTGLTPSQLKKEKMQMQRPFFDSTHT